MRKLYRMKTLSTLVILSFFGAALPSFADGIIIPHRRPGETIPPLTVKYHRVQVEIRDQVARTSIDEVFINNHSRDIEGTFIFPLPENAAISEFALFVGDKKIEGEILDSRENVDFLQRKFDLAFDIVLTREDGLWKPSGAPFLEVLRRLSLEKEECIVVGDSHYDAKAAVEAGIQKVFLLKREKGESIGNAVELCASVEDLKRGVERLIRPASS